MPQRIISPLVGVRRPPRGGDRLGGADVAVDQHRQRGDAEREDEPAEDRADDGTAQDQRPSPRRREYVGQEAADRSRRRPAEQQCIEHSGGHQPPDEDQQQQSRDDPHVVDGRTLAHVEEVEPVDLARPPRGAGRARRIRRRRRARAARRRQPPGRRTASAAGSWSSPPRQSRSECRSARRKKCRREGHGNPPIPCLSDQRRSSSPIVRTGIGPAFARAASEQLSP